MDSLARRTLRLLLDEPLTLALTFEGREIAVPGYRRQIPKWTVDESGARSTVVFGPAGGRMLFDAVTLMVGDDKARSIPLEGAATVPSGMQFRYTAELGVD